MFDLFQVAKIIADIAIIGDIFLLRLLGDIDHDRRFEKDFGGCEVIFLFQKRSHISSNFIRSIMEFTESTRQAA